MAVFLCDEALAFELIGERKVPPGSSEERTLKLHSTMHLLPAPFQQALNASCMVLGGEVPGSVSLLISRTIK